MARLNSRSHWHDFSRAVPVFQAAARFPLAGVFPEISASDLPKTAESAIIAPFATLLSQGGDYPVSGGVDERIKSYAWKAYVG